METMWTWRWWRGTVQFLGVEDEDSRCGLDLGEGGGHCSDEKGAVLIVHRIMFLFRTFFACRAELLCDVCAKIFRL